MMECGGQQVGEGQVWLEAATPVSLWVLLRVSMGEEEIKVLQENAFHWTFMGIRGLAFWEPRTRV